MERLKKLVNRGLELTIFSNLFLVPLAFWLPCNEAFETPKAALFYSVLSLSVALYLFKQALAGRFIVRYTALSFPALLLAAAYTLSFFQSLLINSASAPIHWQFLKMVLAAILLYLLIINTFDRGSINKLVFFIIASHTIVVIYGIMQYFGMDLIKWVSFGEGRVYSTMGNPDYMAAQFSILIPIMLAYLVTPVRPSVKITLSLILSGMFLLVVVSHGRGAWLGFLGSVAYMLVSFGLINGREFLSKNKNFIIALVAFIVLLGVIFSVPNPVNKNPLVNRIKQAFDRTNDSVAVRLFYWESALQMGAAHPVFGVGAGGFALYTSYYQEKVLKRWEKALPDMAARVQPHVELYTHNDYLQLFAETGIVGVGAFALLFFSIFSGALKKARTEPDTLFRTLLIGVSGAVVAYLINALLNFPWRVLPTIILLWSVFSLLSLSEEPKYKSLPFSRNALLAGALLFFLYPAIEARTLAANQYIKEGQRLFASGNYQAAKNAFLSSYANFPRGTDEIELALYAGNAFNSLGDVQTALKYYVAGITAFPNFIESHYNIANVYMNNSMTDKAVEEYNKVLALNPKFINALNNLANIYFNRGEFDKAVEMYKKALEIKPDNPDARYNLAAAYFRMQRYKEAYEELLATLKYTPDYQLAKDWILKMRNAGLVK